MTASDKDTHALAIERQKTLRLMLILGATLCMGAFAIYMLMQGTRDGGGGSVDIDLSAGKISLSMEKPIVQQVELNKKSVSAGGNTVEFTEGKITNKETVNEVLRMAPSQPNQFTGKNFINRDAGFLLSVENPSLWQIHYNPQGRFNPAVPINTIFNAEGSNLNINVSNTTAGMDVQQFVNMNVQSMLQTGMIQQWPEITYDYESQTAFAIITNPMTGGQSYQKIIIDDEGDRAFVASANYNHMLSSPQAIRELTNMIATFTVIQE